MHIKIHPTYLNSLYIDTDNTIYNLIHNNSKGKVSVAFKSENTNEWQEKYGKFNELKIGLFNNFFSINTFTGRRETKNLFELKANFVELDIQKNTSYTKEQVLYFLEEDVFNVEIPTPTLIVDSGHGFWLLWIYDDLTICRKGNNINYNMLNKWNLTQNYLYNALKEYGADSSSLDAARVMRCNDTINWKKGLKPKVVQVIKNYSIKYNLDEIITEITGLDSKEYNLKKNNKLEKNKKKTNVKSNWNIKLTTVNRIRDLEKLLELRDYEIEGNRENLLFIYSYFNLCLTNNLEYTTNQVLSLNDKLINPLPLQEIQKNVINGAFNGYRKRLNITPQGKGGYNYSTSKLIDLLQIEMTEQQFMLTLCDSYIKYKREKTKQKKKIRNNNGLTSREQNKLNNIYICHEYNKLGYTNVQIVEFTGFTKGTVSKYLKEEKPIESLVDLDFISQYFSDL